jgi:hypothetical protein
MELQKKVSGNRSLAEYLKGEKIFIPETGPAEYARSAS